VKLGIPYDAKIAFITFDMKFWRRLLQHDEKLRLIETIINDEGLEHLIEVACAQEYIGREPTPTVNAAVPVASQQQQPSTPSGNGLETIVLAPAPGKPTSSGSELPDVADVEPGAGAK